MSRFDEELALLNKDELYTPFLKEEKPHKNHGLLVAFTSIFLLTSVLILTFKETENQSLSKDFSNSIDTISENDSLCIASSKPILGGYDVVAYFSLEEGSAAVLGSSSYTTEYNGYTFRFANEHNKMLFSKAPIDYVPQFGGFCAYGISSEDFWTWHTIQVHGPASDPNVWEIIDGKLYTFMYEVPKLVFLDGDVASLIKQGSAKWESFTSQQPYNYFNTQCLWFDSECGHDGAHCLKEYMINHTTS